jgi:hypothetical protein
MPKYLVNISKSIEGRFVVDAEDEEAAYHAAIHADRLFDVHDAGWDVIWDVSPLEGDEPKYIPLAEQKEIAKDFLP